jgi:Fic family protein
MTWNWQQPDWPRFAWDASPLTKAEERFLRETGVFLGTVKHLQSEDRDQLTVERRATPRALLPDHRVAKGAGGHARWMIL